MKEVLLAPSQAKISSRISHLLLVTVVECKDLPKAFELVLNLWPSFRHIFPKSFLRFESSTGPNVYVIHPHIASGRYR